MSFSFHRLQTIVFCTAIIIGLAGCSASRVPVQGLIRPAEDYVGSADTVFRCYQALITEENTVKLDGEGLDIEMELKKQVSGKEYFEKIAKKYLPPGELIEENIPGLPVPNRVYKQVREIGEGFGYQVLLYIFPALEGTAVVRIKDNLLHADQYIHNRVQYIIRHGIPPTIILSPSVIDFAGRILPVFSVCLLRPHWVRCPDKGQIKWSIYKTMEQARRSVDYHEQYSRKYEYARVVSEEKIPVIFEGEEVMATCIKFKMEGVKKIMGGSKILIAYYVAAEVRGYYIHCTMSFFENEAAPGGLAPLVEEVMQLR